MKNHIASILWALICTALAVGLLSTKKENARLVQELAARQIEYEQAYIEGSSDEIEQAVETDAVATIQTQANSSAPAIENTSVTNELQSSSRRMMKSMALMMDNPTMNKVMEASQRGAVGALYADMIEYLGLDAEETKYFMDLLMFRQMKQMDLGMKMMGGNLDEEEKKQLTEELKDASAKVKAEMEQFLNNADDYAEFEFYEKTMGERMMLSSMDQKLAATDAALSDESYRDLLGMMNEEKERFNFSSDLHDEQNMNLDEERFSKENLQNHINDMDQLHEIIIARARDMLTPEQLQAFIDALQATAEMQKAQMEMAAQMLGGNK